ncbi:MAG: hypothetical protein ACM3UW_09760, partial [Bacillota bacterium]
LKVFVRGKIEDDPSTYPFMDFKETMTEPYQMFKPSLLKPETGKSTSPSSASRGGEPDLDLNLPEELKKIISPQNPAYLEDETVDPSREFDIIN